MFTKLRTVIYHVDNLEAAKSWYQHVTRVLPYFEAPFYVGFDINGCELGLDPDLSMVQRGNQSVAYWAVDDIDVSVRDLLKAGAVLLDPIKEVGGGIRVAVVEDPFGNAVGVIEETVNHPL